MKDILDISISHCYTRERNHAPMVFIPIPLAKPRRCHRRSPLDRRRRPHRSPQAMRQNDEKSGAETMKNDGLTWLKHEEWRLDYQTLSFTHEKLSFHHEYGRLSHEKCSLNRENAKLTMANCGLTS